jgi:hypothetical protein
MMRILKHVLEVLFACGLAVAYIGGAVGLLGWIDARDVAACALFGGAFSFVTAVVYFIIADLETRHRVSSAR